MFVPEGHVIKSDYVLMEDIVFPHGTSTMAVASVKEKIDALSHSGRGQSYPLPVITWKDGRPHLWDGRHRYLAHLMMGRTHMLVCWVEPGE